MPIIQPVIRPPSEAESVLIQVTTGCSANTCTFCGAYTAKSFRIKDFSEISDDIVRAAAQYPDARRIFLMDGDALVLSNQKLIPILKALVNAFPHVTRIASYANGYNIAIRTKSELDELYQNSFKLIYIGLESGSQKILDLCQKRSKVSEMIHAVHCAHSSMIKASVIVLLGLGGRELSSVHVQETIRALNEMQPRYLSFLSLMLIPGTPLYEERTNGLFRELSAQELLQEMYDIIAGLDLKKTIFRTDHASNYLPLEGRFPVDKNRLLDEIADALHGKSDLRHEFLRGL